MPWVLLIIAMIVSVLVELACFGLKIKNFAIVLVLQFFASLGATYAISYRFAGSLQEAGMDNILLSCAGISLAIVVLFAVLRYYFGSWYTRKPGPGMK